MKKQSVMDILNIVFFVLLLGMNFLLPNTYPVTSPEALVFMAAAMGVLILMWGILKCVHSVWLFYGILLFVFFDLAAGFGFTDEVFWPAVLLPKSAHHPLFLIFHPLTFLMGSLFKHLSSRLAILAVSYGFAFLGAGYLAYALRNRIAKLILWALVLMWVTTLVQFAVMPGKIVRTDINAQQQPTHLEKPNILIIVLDEHIGIEGIPPLDEKIKQLKEGMVKNYTEKGFTVYGRAYSNYYYTNLSVPNLLNQSLIGDSKALTGSKLLLEKLAGEGYALNIYQNTHVDFCRSLTGKYHQCLEYNRNSVGFFQHEKLPVFDKAVVLLAAFVEAQKSTALRKGWWQLSRRFRNIPWGRFEPVSFFSVLPKIEKDMSVQKGGAVFFAHFLMPHSPYLYNGNCEVTKFPEWDYRLIDSKNRHESSWDDKNRRYLQQVACTHKRLGQTWDVMRSLGIYDSSTILIFGDHGSRIYGKMPYLEDEANTLNFDAATKRDLIALFSAFLAVKESGAIQGGNYISEKTPLAKVIRNLFNLPIAEVTEKDFEKIYLRSKKVKEFFPFEMVDF